MGSLANTRSQGGNSLTEEDVPTNCTLFSTELWPFYVCAEHVKTADLPQMYCNEMAIESRSAVCVCVTEHWQAKAISSYRMNK